MPSNPSNRVTVIATRGSALALAQAHSVLAQCRTAFPHLEFRIQIIKTTGDKLQTASMANPQADSVKGLFTKELEVALLNHEADMAVHSLKDLPTDLPPGLCLGAVCPRADVRDVLIYRDAASLGGAPETSVETFHEPFLGALASLPAPEVQRRLAGTDAGAPRFRVPMQAQKRKGSLPDQPSDRRIKRGFCRALTIQSLPPGATVATSSTRRQAQLLALRPDLKVVPIRGNVGTRLQKLHDQPQIDGLILAKAGLERLGFRIRPDGHLGAETDPASQSKNANPENRAAPPNAPPRTPHLEGLLATVLETEIMLPCVGQGAVAIEIRESNERLLPLCARLNHHETGQCVLAERSFLRAMGGGCQSPVAAYAEVAGDQIRLRAVSFRDGPARRTEIRGSIQEALALGEQAAAQLLSPEH